jgi:hypothetical protein
MESIAENYERRLGREEEIFIFLSYSRKKIRQGA